TATLGAGPAPSTTAPPSPKTPAQAAAKPLVPAQVPAVATPANQDVGAGRQIAAQGAPGAAACSSCHGANGEGSPAAGFPRLAGQGRIYIEHQLNSYADGTRAHPVM